MVNRLWQQFPIIIPQLTAISQRIQTATRIREPAVDQLVQGQTRAGGKMLRSGLMLMVAQLAGQPQEEALITAGAAIEVLHLATLVHDDVLDAAPIRRKVQTLQPTVGNREAIYAGDFLFSVYFELLAQLPTHSVGLGINATTMRRIFLGELDQNGHLKNSPLTTRQYLRQITGKTAALFSLATETGARLSGQSPEMQRAAYHYGLRVGMAFQMIDDILDYQGDPQTMHKPVLEDLKNGVYTLPLIYAIQKAPNAFAPFLSDLPHHIDQVTPLVTKFGLPQAQKCAQLYTNKALRALSVYPKSHAKTNLLQLSDQLLGRIG